MTDPRDGALKLHADGDRLMQEWIGAEARIKRLEDELYHAKMKLREATDKLGAWLVLKDAKPAEEFNVWYIDALITAHISLEDGKEGFVVRVRTSGREWERMVENRRYG